MTLELIWSAERVPLAQPHPPDSPYLRLYRASPQERIEVIKRGLQASEAKRIIAILAIGQGAVLKALDLSPATVNKKAKHDQALSPGESERVLGVAGLRIDLPHPTGGVAKLVGQLEAMVRESGDPDGFDAAAWMSEWLKQPVPALGGARPLDLLDTIEGQNLVSTVLAQMQSGAYA